MYNAYMLIKGARYLVTLCLLSFHLCTWLSVTVSRYDQVKDYSETFATLVVKLPFQYQMFKEGQYQEDLEQMTTLLILVKVGVDSHTFVLGKFKAGSHKQTVKLHWAATHQSVLSNLCIRCCRARSEILNCFLQINFQIEAAIRGYMR